MKKLFTQPENWLLIISLILFFIEKLFIGESVLDLHIHDTYFVLSGSSLMIIILLLLIVPYCCHLLLKAKATSSLLFTHVISTVILTIASFVCSSLITAKPRRYFNFADWESYQHLERFNNLLISMVAAFLLIQLLFVAYTISRLLSKK